MTIRYTTFFLLLFFTGASLASESTPDTSGLTQYWYNTTQLQALPEPKPALAPQCQGVFFKPIDATQLQMNEDAQAGSQTITADRALYSADGISVFEGNVIVTQGEQSISGNRLQYDHQSKQLDIEGNVQIESEGLLIVSEHATYDSELERTELHEAQFLLFENALNGQAQRIRVAQAQIDVYQNSISSCPPGEKNWELKSSELHLDRDKGWGHAKHASLHIASVPVLYAPYFTFPLDDRRKTGFLYPSLGVDSVNGVDIATPYYVNIAPNYDATITPRLLSKRGTQIGAEFRYLNDSGEGSISGDYLGQDDINPLYTERKQAQWLHKKQFSENWYADVDYAYVSDSDYFDDLDALSDNTHLGYVERSGALMFIDSRSYFSILAQDFQVFDTIADVDKPYRLAPQIAGGHEYSLATLPLSLSLDTQLSRFERDLDALAIGAAAVSAGALTTGERLVLQPQLVGNFSSAAWFVKPAARLHHRQYQLEDYRAENQDKTFEYSIPIYSLDSGLIFERDISIRDSDLKQTLEPRLKFVSIPYKDQSDAPNFDSSLLNFNQNQLYRERRYAGNDVVGDTEQLTFGLGSRIYTRNGVEKLELEIGQITYFEDRKIQLDATEDTQADFSPVFGRAKYRLIPDWTLIQKVQWDSEENVLNQFSSGIHYKNAQHNIFNLEFRYRPASFTAPQKETRASFIWPVNHQWKAMSFWNYGLEQKATIELASGLEYENCCIVVRALNQKWLRRISSSNSYESANKQSLEIQLKGLGNLNNQISNYLQDRIVGFNE